MMKKLGLIIFLFVCCLPVLVNAQGNTTSPHPENVKLLDEYSDGKGNIVRKVSFKQGNFIVTQTIIMPKTVRAGIRVPVRADTLKKELLTIFVDKSDYMVRLTYGNRTIRTYKAVFGPSPMTNKRMEGDRCTPEGYFKIASKNPSSKYDRFMGLNYPNDSCTKRFNALKADGSIPPTARIGGDVGIHGIWPGGDDMIEMGIGWTDGCIALKNRDIEELFSFVGVGTKVVVQK